MSENLDIPAFLKRPVTPETKAAVTRLNKQLRRGARRVETTGRSTISTGYAVPTDDVGKALLREVLKSNASELQKDRARRALRNARGKTMTTPGPKERALAEARAEKPIKVSAVNQRIIAKARELNAK